jgi:hypothetical protein
MTVTMFRKPVRISTMLEQPLDVFPVLVEHGVVKRCCLPLAKAIYLML